MSFDGKSYLHDQAGLRERLIVVLKFNGKSIVENAKDIGIVVCTLRAFMAGNDASWKTLCKIEKYIADNNV
jgi:predicted transcriptional regulator